MKCQWFITDGSRWGELKEIYDVDGNEKLPNYDSVISNKDEFFF